MSTHTKQVLLGTRVPAQIKEKLSHYCASHGVKINFFVALAIKEKLEQIDEDLRDVASAKERMKNAAYLDQNAMDEYLGKRGISS